MYVLTPNSNGLNTPYLLNPPKQPLEEAFYSQHGKIPLPESGRWHIHQPKETIRNLELMPSSLSYRTVSENFLEVPVKSKDGKDIEYEGSEKNKIVVRKSTDLEEIIEELV